MIEALELELEPLAEPTDLSRGAEGFRHHRKHLRSLRFRALPERIAELAQVRKQRLRFDGFGSGATHLTLIDRMGPVALDVDAFADGFDLVVVPRRLRLPVGIEGDPSARVGAAAGRLGLLPDRSTGGFRFPDALAHLVAEALMPHGWRPPSLTSPALAPGLEVGELVYALDGESAGAKEAVASEREPRWVAAAAETHSALKEQRFSEAQELVRSVAELDPSPWLAIWSVLAVLFASQGARSTREVRTAGSGEAALEHAFPRRELLALAVDRAEAADDAQLSFRLSRRLSFGVLERSDPLKGRLDALVRRHLGV